MHRRAAGKNEPASPRSAKVLQSCHGRSMGQGTSFRALTRACISDCGSGSVTSASNVQGEEMV